MTPDVPHVNSVSLSQVFLRKLERVLIFLHIWAIARPPPG